MVTGKSQPGAGTIPSLPASATHHEISTSPPSKRDLASWWRQFKRNTRKEEVKEKPQGIFGVPLNVSIKYANVAISLTNDNGESFIYGYVPIVVAKCGVFLKEKATDVEGIFRLNGSAKRIKDLQEIFDSPERYGKGLDWTGYTVHDAANVLRRYLNQLPEPIVPLDFYERFREPLRVYQKQALENGPTADSEAFDHAKAVAAYQQLIRELPPLNKQLLLYILDLLAVFASKSDQNRMTSANLSAIFQPGLLSHPQHDMSPDEYKLSQDVLIFLIENQDHFLFGMNGTAADEQTLKEVEGASRRQTNSSNIRRSVSSASGGAESFRKYGSLRRNVSVSSKNSHHSNHPSSPVTPTSLNGVGVHRSNTLPSKMSPITAARYGRVLEATGAPPSGLNPSVQNSRSSSRAPPSREEASQTTATAPTSAPSDAATGPLYVHSSTHGPMPINTVNTAPMSENPVLHEALPTTISSPPPPVVTPTRERKLSSFFTKSPPQNGESKEPRQPNRLKKKRIPGSASESAHSSSLSLQAATSESVLNVAPIPTRPQEADSDAGEVTPRPPNTADPGDDSASPSNRDVAAEEKQAAPNDSHNADTSLKPHSSRTPSMNSRSSFTDHSDLDQADDRVDRREHRRSWRFPRSSKRSNEQIGLGLGSPPLLTSNPSAERSTSSVGSWHHSSKSSPSDLQQFANDPSQHPLSLDAEINNNHGISKESLEPEKRSLFGKFKAKVAQVRDGVRDSERDRTRSPAQTDPERPVSSKTLSPAANDRISTTQPAPIELPKEGKDEFNRSPVSPIMPTSGLPPVIPEEPRTPESPVASRTFEAMQDSAAAPAAPTTPLQAENPPISEANEKSNGITPH
ncbi:putative Rho GTPase activator (Sac7) [Aspergillus clavatus NRRL 1]|uniref:Rho GTPase activator (Sac7), putative n=1 Tax=Aspergillus clavatus (strain ATCC 1007 / CBS 513.65 / DSM 816 / NCTC 3887 / NRRL 1 / QM 1276 / 107) TaxID=344612 RepID=A1CFT8_ASPCL|nr:Rho GTPase activator (Sac7), putative [Aspergillus clavatus NRRL 1]EAW11737.1 Rho GTPase activator (Sac7), putative [Aspergillus clavatus NRRL 1]